MLRRSAPFRSNRVAAAWQMLEERRQVVVRDQETCGHVLPREPDLPGRIPLYQAHGLQEGEEGPQAVERRLRGRKSRAERE